MQKLVFVINPISGGKVKDEIETTIPILAEEHNFSYDIYHTTGEGDHKKIQEFVTKLNPDKVVAVGGDGTLKMVAEALMKHTVPIGIVPAGSANGMARELELPLDIAEAMDTILNGSEKKLDAICVNDKDICLHLSDIGMNAQLVKYFEENDLRGKWGYVLGAIKMLWHRTRMEVRISNGQQSIKRNAFMIVLANARMYGTGAMINPEGDLHDGIFEVIVVRRLTIISLIKMFFKSNNFNRKQIEIIPAQAVEIKVRKKAYFQVDGEYKGRTNNISAVIMKQVINVMLPDRNGES